MWWCGNAVMVWFSSGTKNCCQTKTAFWCLREKGREVVNEENEMVTFCNTNKHTHTTVREGVGLSVLGVQPHLQTN